MSQLIPIKHALVNQDTLTGEFCEILDMSNIFGDMAQCLSTLLQLPQSDASGLVELGLWEDTRTDEINLVDFEGLIKETPALVPAFEGGRVVFNLWPTADGSATPSTQANIPVISGHEYALTIGAASASGATAVCTDAFTGTVTGNATNRISWSDDTPRTAATAELDVAITGSVVEIILEDVTGQSNQNPSEYVAVLGDSDPEDGFAYYATENGNTVSSGVVTEAVGSAISPAPYWAQYPAATNYADGDDDLSGGAETVDLTTPSTGDYTLSVYGTAAVTVAAGTATGTGFGQATEGTDVTFNLSGAGTVTLTLDSGALDVYGGAAMKQVEKLTFSTPFIITSGTAGVNRDRTRMRHPFSATYFNQTAGTLIFDWTPEYNKADVSNGSNDGLIALKANSVSLYYTNTVGKMKTVDDFGNNSADQSTVLVNGNRYIGAVTWATGGLITTGTKDIDGDGLWYWESITVDDYGGAFTSSSWIELFYTQPFINQLHAMKIYNSEMSHAWIEANY